MACGIASGLSVTVISSPVMAGNGWWGQLLNPLAAKKDLMKLSSLLTFSGIGGKGMSAGSGGGGSLFKQPHSALGVASLTELLVEVQLADGKLLGSTFKSIKAFSDSKHPRVFRAKYIIWLVCVPFADILTGRTPIISRRALVTPLIPWDVDSRFSTVHPSWMSNGISPEQV